MALRETDPPRIGGYPVEDRLGSGGMGVVYLARSASGRRLAVKVVHGQYADDPEFRARFRREVAAARQVSGAFTAPVVDADADAARPWMATLYIPGENLGTHVRREGPLPPDRLLELAAGLTEALRDIHRVGVVHRDLKPANVMLAEDGPRVIDFGVSRAAEALASDPLTQTGRVMGTPPYMSPEQLTSPRDVGPASDIFSLGSVLTYAATGRGPFDSESPYETATGVVESVPELDRVPAELRPFVTQCLAKHPKERPTPDELLALLRGEPLPPPSAREAAEPVRPRRRRRGLAIAAAGVLLAGVASGLALWLTDTDPEARDLPRNWRAWEAKDTSDREEEGGPFGGCVAAGSGLFCAGDDVKAARFSLATGTFAWSKPIDRTPTDMGDMEGRVIGVSGGRVFTYRNDQVDRDETPVPHYAIQALDVRTGKELWTTATQHGEDAEAPVPDAEHGGAVWTDKGVLTALGVKGDDYALLRNDTGKPRWRDKLPSVHCRVRGAEGHGYLLCADSARRTRVSRLDLATGKPDWTVTVPYGGLELLGQASGRLVFRRDEVDGTPRTISVLDLATRRVRTLPLAPRSPDATPTVTGGTLYFTYRNGNISAIDPRTGRERWSVNSVVEAPGPPLESGTHVYLASVSGRVAALDRRTGEEKWSLPARGTGAGMTVAAEAGARLTLVGDALYVPYDVRAVYSVDVRNP
ncbi:serine/threonine-protein kinase [Streptomyces sp. NPDC127108]|uniref:serine/threonine-protein kinase n=1 Tax=Streptomyces sp. NPDC127108 TaxID=3345361 RepID=UPI0036457A9F